MTDLDLRPLNVAAATIEFQGNTSDERNVFICDRTISLLIWLDQKFIAEEVKVDLFWSVRAFISLALLECVEASGVGNQVSSVDCGLARQTLLFDFHLTVVFPVLC